MRIAFAGTPDFAVPPLAALCRAAPAHAVVGVLTQPDRPAGRGQRLAQGPVKQYALSQGLPVAQPPTLRDEAGRASLREWAPDLLVVVAYGLILPPAALAIPRLGCLNIHASLLPRWRGAAPIQRAVLAGDPETGVAIMRMEAGLDTGPVLRTRRVTIGPRSTSGSVHDVLAALGAAELVAALGQIEAGEAHFEPQPAEGVTYAAKIDKAEARLDWRESATALDRRVRAFDPWPGAEARLGEEPLKILQAQPLDDAAAGRGAGIAPGTVLGLRGGALHVACGAGVLAIERLQRAGRRPVSAREFANGVALDGGVLG
ncbi:MAG: methionyl-tRNA formyltransferase [Steroidobacteraceae bacterium]|jgi:methionyl-tRNA formyltransferase|nr:methionyl-tRNA formyltransferase [Steroidobacteraceae bacterium]